jgi:3-methyl-2-oxobutanoate hydroxymethyltransferase
VCAHLGFTPQSVHALGGYRIQGRDDTAASAMRRHAQELADAGAGMLVLELTPAALAREITAASSIPIIGIGAGSGCSGQVLVLQDMLGITRGKQPRFVRDFAESDPSSGRSVDAAVRLYVSEVKSGRFPDDALHGY